MSGALIAASMPGGIIINLTGASGISGADPGPSSGDARAGVRINTDGTIDKYEYDGSTATYTQLSADTDWINKPALAGNYFVRCTDNNANLDASSAATGSWLAMSSGYLWYIRLTSFGSKSLDITLAISADESTTIDDGGYTGTATVGL